MNKKLLLSGCSLSDFSGWGKPGNKSDPRCWYNLVAQENQFDLMNVSYGGKSNKEIIHAAMQAMFCSPNKYDIVIVQLTATGRNWFFNTLDPDYFYITNYAGISNYQDKDEYNSLNIVRKRFNNLIRQVERDLVNLVALHKIAESKGIKLILLNFLDFADTIRSIKNFATRPEVEVSLKPDVICGHFTDPAQKKIVTLSRQLDYSHKLGFDVCLCGPPYVEDFADDGDHPGEKSNRTFANLVNDLLKKIND